MLYNNPDPDSYLGTSPSAGTMDVGNSITYKFEQGALSYFGRLSYNYGDKYLFQFIFRTDASTKFSPSNYWGFSRSVSVSWVASEEPFSRIHFLNGSIIQNYGSLGVKPVRII